MCKLCRQGILQNHFGSRRNFLKGAAATGVAAAGLNLFASRPAAAQFADAADPPQDTGRPNRRYVIRGGSVMSMDPKVGDFAEADVLVQGKTHPRRRTEPGGRHRRRDRRARAHRHARLHRYAPSPVRDGAAQLPRRRGSHQRWLRHAEREHHLLRVYSQQVRARVPSAGRVHQRAVRCSQPARRRRHDRARRVADPSHAAAFGRRHPGPVRFRTPLRLRLFRGRGKQPRRTMPIRRTRSASTSSGSPRATSSSP